MVTRFQGLCFISRFYLHQLFDQFSGEIEADGRLWSSCKIDEIKKSNKSQMVEPWDHAANSQMSKIS